jgi:FkbM family methyltransferase
MQGPLRGKRWITGSSDHGCWLGTYEFEKQKAFSRMVRRGDVIYDLGANVGWYTLLGSVLGASRVYSFEPAAENVLVLREHLRLNRIENCTVFQSALGRNSGTAYFEAGPSNSTGHLVTHSASNTTSVPRVCMDDLIESEGLLPPDVIKCDVEGAEFEVLLGARKTLETGSPAILVATHTAELHRLCSEFLHDLHYTTGPIAGTRLEDEMLAWKAK